MRVYMAKHWQVLLFCARARANIRFPIHVCYKADIADRDATLNLFVVRAFRSVRWII